MSVQIPLSRGLFALVDQSDFDLVACHAWNAKPALSGNRKLPTVPKHYAQCAVQKKTVYMHRLIIDAPSGTSVDHVNGDGLDNRRSNLRLATGSQQSANSRRPGNISGFRGLYRTHSMTWRPRIVVNGKSISGRAHEKAEDAARGYDELAIRYFGEFAVLNFPKESVA